MCLPVTGKQLVFLQPGQVSMADGRIQAEVIAHFLLHPTELLGPQSPAAKGDGEAAIGSAFWVLAGYDELVRLLERVVQPLQCYRDTRILHHAQAAQLHEEVADHQHLPRELLAP